MKHRKFLIYATVIALSTLLSVVALNVLIDPYAMFEFWRTSDVNEIKPVSGTRVRVTKPYQLIRAKPRVLVAGNSRPELGINPDSSCWAPEDRPVYNAGIPGVGVYTQARLIQAALLEGGVDRVYWGLDFLDFLGKRHLPPVRWPLATAEIDSRLPTDSEGKPSGHRFVRQLLDMRDSTLSLDAALDSIVTLARQRDPFSSTRQSNGFNPARDYFAIVNTEGQGVLFEQKNLEIIKRLLSTELSLFPPDEDWSREFESVRFVLGFADRMGVKVDLFINPYHADYLTAIELGDKWLLLEQWKQTLVGLADKFGTATLWDFNGFDKYSTKSPPENMPRGQSLEWYWEPAHYRAELGELMIARMRGHPCNKHDQEFGVSVSMANIEQHLKSLRLQKTMYARQFADRWTMLAGIVDRVTLTDDD